MTSCLPGDTCTSVLLLPHLSCILGTLLLMGGQIGRGRGEKGDERSEVD